MLSDDYHWKRPGLQRRRPENRLSHWVTTALVLSVAAHGLLWALFATFKVRPLPKLTLTEPFSIKRSTFDATVLANLPADPGIPETTANEPTLGEESESSVAEELASLTEFSQDDLPVDFLVNAEIKLTPTVEDVENLALDAPGTGDLDDALDNGEPSDPLQSSELAQPHTGLDPQPSPLDPDHPTLTTGDLLGDLAEFTADPTDSTAEGGGGDLIPAGYARLDEVLGMKGQGDPGKPIWVPTDVLFEFNSAELRDDARLSLMKLGALIMQRRDSEFILEGHTDLIGDEAYNLALSINRATAIRNWLIEALRLDPHRIKVLGHGESKPIILEGTAEEQAPNRRVEVTIQPLGTSGPLN